MKLIKLLNLIGCLGVLCLIGTVISCNSDPLVNAFDAAAQQRIDIDIIEQYLSDNGYTDYDTLDTDVRVVILEEGDGETIEYNENIRFEFIAAFTSDTIFDTSVAQAAYNQDIANIIDSVHVRDENGQLEIDRYGFQVLDEVNYEIGYSAIYSPLETYRPLITTHSLEGWFIDNNFDFKKDFGLGFTQGAHHVLENTNIGGRGLILLPSFLAYGRAGTFRVDGNTVVLFEIRTIEKK